MRNAITNKRVDKYIHRLVSEYFLDNPKNKKIVNHKDCNRSNNIVSNLEWVTSKENIEYAMKMGNLKRCENTGRMLSNIKHLH